jgi:hypothetical protein
MLQDSSSNQTSPQVLTNQTFEADREAVRHVIIGSPLGVRRTIHQLHALRYEEAVRWTHPIAIPDNRIIITPDQGEIMSLLVKLIRLQWSHKCAMDFSRIESKVRSRISSRCPC